MLPLAAWLLLVATGAMAAPEVPLSYTPVARAFNVRVFTNVTDAFPEARTDTNWGVPSLSAKLNVGVALAGGGLRSAATVAGAVRALRQASQLR